MVFGYCSPMFGSNKKESKSGTVLTTSREGTNGLKNATYPLRERCGAHLANGNGGPGGRREPFLEGQSRPGQKGRHAGHAGHLEILRHQAAQGRLLRRLGRQLLAAD